MCSSCVQAGRRCIREKNNNVSNESESDGWMWAMGGRRQECREECEVSLSSAVVCVKTVCLHKTSKKNNNPQSTTKWFNELSGHKDWKCCKSHSDHDMKENCEECFFGDFCVSTKWPGVRFLSVKRKHCSNLLLAFLKRSDISNRPFLMTL